MSFTRIGSGSTTLVYRALIAIRASSKKFLGFEPKPTGLRS
jgi:hypothetical protein